MTNQRREQIILNTICPNWQSNLIQKEYERNVSEYEAFELTPKLKELIKLAFTVDVLRRNKLTT